jgi:transposase
MVALVAGSPACTARAAALRLVPGIGTTTALILLASLPELGSLSRRQAASLAGLAPHPRDSGTIRGRRTTPGGRRSLRPILFCAALAAARTTGPLASFYKRLLAAGKSKRLALVALMRKIVVIANARLRDLRPTQPQLT